MLVLSRRLYEKIHLEVTANGKTIHLSVQPVYIDRNKVRLGIEAPDCVDIFRDDINQIRHGNDIS